MNRSRQKLDEMLVFPKEGVSAYGAARFALVAAHSKLIAELGVAITAQLRNPGQPAPPDWPVQLSRFRQSLRDRPHASRTDSQRVRRTPRVQ